MLNQLTMTKTSDGLFTLNYMATMLHPAQVIQIDKQSN